MFDILEKDIQRVLITADQLARRVPALAKEIAQSYASLESHLTIIAILNGSIIFLADLIRHMPLMMKLELITVSSYSGKTTQSVEARLTGALTTNLTGQDVLIVDDILDTGKTIRLTQQEIRKQRPKSLKTVVLLRKPDKAPKDVEVEFIGFDIEDEFVVGYGLDYNNHYRNLPYIAVLNPDAL